MEKIDVLIEELQTVIRKVSTGAPFKRIEFNGIGDSFLFPSLNFNLVSRSSWDRPAQVPESAQLRWELEYDVHVLCAALPNQTTRKEMRKVVDIATDIFAQQMLSEKYLDNLAFKVYYDDVKYDVMIGQEVGSGMKNVYGGVFKLYVQFMQQVK